VRTPPNKGIGSSTAGSETGQRAVEAADEKQLPKTIARYSGWTKAFTDPASAPPSWTGSPSAATSSKPGPSSTGWLTPERSEPPTH
jgi:hypothetical protein